MTVLQFAPPLALADPNTTTTLSYAAVRGDGSPLFGSARYRATTNPADLADSSRWGDSFSFTGEFTPGVGEITVTVGTAPLYVGAYAEDEQANTDRSGHDPGELVGYAVVVPRGSSPTVPPLPSLDPVPGVPSDECTSGEVADGFAGDVYLRVRVQQLGDRTRVCVRGDAASGGFGGKLEVLSPPGTPSTPYTEATHTGCQAADGNGPLASGEWSEAGQPDYVPYLLDAYSVPGRVGVCVQAGSVSRHVVIPTGGASVPVPIFTPDPPGSSTPTGTSAAPVASSACRNSTTGSKERIFDALVAGTQGSLYLWRESLTRVHVCVRASGVSSAGGVLTVDTSKGSGSAPTPTLGSDTTGCSVQQFQTSSPAFVRLSRSGSIGLPASVCLQIGGSTYRVTVSSGSANPLDTAHFTSD